MKRIKFLRESWVVYNTHEMTPQQRMMLLIKLRAARFRVYYETTDEFDQKYPYLYHDDDTNIVSECRDLQRNVHFDDRYRHEISWESLTAFLEALIKLEVENA